jgi:dihydroorotate dehydrogenase (NAD+) catalytic subunit
VVVVDAEVNLAGLQLRSPITLASGTCGYGLELAEYEDLTRLGAIFTKGLTYEPREGNAPWRGAEVPSGMINRIGLQNVGVKAFVREKLPPLAALGVPVVANVAGATMEEYVAIVEHLDGAPGLAGIELNVSCPNVDCGGIEFGTDAGTLCRLVERVRARTRLPIWVKLTPHAPIAEMARAAEAGGADGLCAINTLPAMAVKPVLRDGRLVPEIVRGGLSGPALRPVALRCVYEARQATRLPVIGIGGIATLEDVLAFLAVGASAVQIGTASFIEPGIGTRLGEELQAWLQAGGYRSLREVMPEVGL